jgi:hypothetical protein
VIALIKKVIKDCLTEDDGQSYCGAKVASFIALFCYLGNVTYAIHSAQTLDFSAFGTGLASVLAGCGALIAGKQLSKKD